MKKLLTLIIGLFCLLGYSQDTIKNELFEIVYSQALEQPLYVKYRVLCPEGTADRKGIYFYSPEDLHTSDDADYENNVWDKGHMAPANAFNCNRDSLRKTFSFVNCALQHRSLNRGAWSRLENFEHDLALIFDVDVEVIVFFKGPPNRLTTGAYVPSGFKKTIRFDGYTISFYFPNKDPNGKKWPEFRID